MDMMINFPPDHEYIPDKKYKDFDLIPCERCGLLEKADCHVDTPVDKGEEEV